MSKGTDRQFTELAQRVIGEAEQIKCKFSEFAEGLEIMRDEIQERLELAKGELRERGESWEE